MTRWRLERGDDNTFEPELFDAKVADTANPFGNYAEASIDDFGGTKFDDYPYGTRIDLTFADDDTIDAILEIADGDTHTIDGTTEAYQLAQVGGTLQIGGAGGKLQLGGDGFQNRFTGYVVERREGDNAGADELNIIAYTYDQFLRRNRVTNDQSGNTISEALEDIITTDVDSVAWNASNVTVVDDQTLTQSYRGDKVEDAIRSMSFKSGDEAFGVTDDAEFTFNPREESRAPRDIDDTQWLDYDIPEVGNEAINEVTVFFNGGDESVTVDAGDAKLDLEESLDLDGPGTQSAELTREDLTNIEDARGVGEQYLRLRNATITGEVMTYGLEAAEPGEVVNIVIAERGIDGDFLIAENDMEWGIDQQALTIVEKRGDTDDILIRLSDSVDRREEQAKNRDGESNTVVSTELRAITTVTAEIDASGGIDSVGNRFVNSGFTQIRDAWDGDGSPIDVTHIAVGDDASGLSRSNTALGNETSRVAVSETLNGSDGVTYDGDFGDSTIREVGLFDTNGNLVARAVFDDNSLSGTNTVSVTVTASNDSGVSRGVVTDTGVTLVRDIIAGNSPSAVSEYRYGTDGTEPTESDTALGNLVRADALSSTQVQFAINTQSWGDIVSPAETTPLAVDSNGDFASLQSCFFGRTDDLEGGEAIDSDGSLTDNGWDDADAMNYDDASPLEARYLFTPEYTIPAENVGIAARIEGDWPNGIIALANDDLAFELAALNRGDSPAWEVLVGDTSNLSGTFTDLTGANQTTYSGGDLSVGEQVIAAFNANGDNSGGTDTPYLDCLVVFDDRFEYSFDNDLNDPELTLDGPESYPAQQEFTFAAAMTRREFDVANVDSTWNDTTGDQFIALSNDGGNTFLQTDNSETASETFAGVSTELIVKVALSRFAGSSPAVTSPQTGNTGQIIEEYFAFAEIDAITPDAINALAVNSINPPNTITGEVLEEAGQHDGSNLVTHSIYAPVTVSADERIIGSEVVRFANP